MVDFFTIILVYLAIWGWILLAAFLLLQIVKEVYHLLSGASFRMGRVVTGGFLLLVYAAWFNMSLPYTFGLKQGEIVSADGQRSATIEKEGRIDKIVVDGEHDFPLTFRPRSAFWMRDGTAIGVVSENGHAIVIEVDMHIDNFSMNLTPDQEKRMGHHRYKLTESELAQFELAQRRAKQSGLIWEKR